MSNWSKPKNLESTSPEPDNFNAAEVLACLSSQYEEALAAAKRDKLGDKVRVYRSLDSSSAWSTKGAKKAEEERYNLLHEVNRAMAKRSSNTRT